MIKVSVIIPVYNVEPWLKACLDSIINQTLKDIEIICVNDASTDNSLELLRQYEQLDSRIVVLNHDGNSGLSASRNTGAQYATGEYIYFLDSDDMIKPNAIEILYNKAKSDKLDVLCFDGETFFENEQLEKIYKFEERWCVRNKEYTAIKVGKDLLIEMLFNNDYKAVVWILFINREFFNSNKLSFINGILYEDNPFTLEVFIKANRVSHIKDRLYIRRVRESSITTSNSTFNRPYGFFVCYIKMMELTNQYLTNVNYNSLIFKEVFRMIKCCRSEFAKCSKDEKEKYLLLEPVEQEMFKYLVVDYCNSENKCKSLVKKVKRLEEDVKKNIEIQKQFKENDIYLRKSIANLRNGWSFRIGRLLTWLPRKLLRRNKVV